MKKKRPRPKKKKAKAPAAKVSPLDDPAWVFDKTIPLRHKVVGLLTEVRNLGPHPENIPLRPAVKALSDSLVKQLKGEDSKDRNRAIRAVLSGERMNLDRQRNEAKTAIAVIEVHGQEITAWSVEQAAKGDEGGMMGTPELVNAIMDQADERLRARKRKGAT